MGVLLRASSNRFRTRKPYASEDMHLISEVLRLMDIQHVPPFTAVA